jgi:O-antigen/teichoic acid export membrane protein
MDTRRLLSSSALYGLADMAVVVVGGFLLLPLYTRALSQAEFGHYVAVRANIDILTYALHLGIPSAVARLYFNHRRAGEQHAYISSVLWMFLATLTVLSGILLFLGETLWSLLSPGVPAQPALSFALAISTAGFLAAISVIWLRSEGRVIAVIGLQLGAAAVMAAVAIAALLVAETGLDGILLALFVSALVPATALPALLGRRFLWRPRRADVVQTLKFALPVLIGYLAYFVLNRFSTLLLQRHVTSEELGVFGLAQQLSMIVAMACTSFGAALQPMIFGSDAAHVNDALARAGRLLLLMMTAVFATLMLFAHELIAIVAPHGYGRGLEAMTVLAVGNFTLAATLVSETALLYHHKIKASVTISIASAVTAAGLGLWLVPTHHVAGGALAVAGGFLVRMLMSQWAAWRVTGTARWRPALGGTAAAAGIGWAALQIQALPLAPPALVGVKAAALALIGIALFLCHRKCF